MDMNTAVANCGHERQNNLAILSKDKERELIRLAQAGDKRAGSELLASFRQFVLSAVRKRKPSADLLDLFDDLVAAGMTALWDAILRFDLERNCRLATYAAPWIDGAVAAEAKAARRHGGVGETRVERFAYFQPERGSGD